MLEKPFGLSLAGALVGVLSACGGAEPPPSEIEPTGPPTVRPGVIAAHARQFDEEIAERPAGSQEEQGASQYILGHLQQAGYFVQLDSVPVANLVESTNLVALPPSGEPAETIVTVGYDADDDTPPSGETIGLFLELARALYAAEPGHRVEFVALGAETTVDRRGSRRLAQQLREEERDVDVITLVPGAKSLGARGSLADAISEAAREVGLETTDLPAEQVDVFAQAGFDSALVGGPPQELARALLAYLQEGDG